MRVVRRNEEDPVELRQRSRYPDASRVRCVAATCIAGVRDVHEAARVDRERGAGHTGQVAGHDRARHPAPGPVGREGQT